MCQKKSWRIFFNQLAALKMQQTRLNLPGTVNRTYIDVKRQPLYLLGINVYHLKDWHHSEYFSYNGAFKLYSKLLRRFIALVVEQSIDILDTVKVLDLRFEFYVPHYLVFRLHTKLFASREWNIKTDRCLYSIRG